MQLQILVILNINKNSSFFQFLIAKFSNETQHSAIPDQ